VADLLNGDEVKMPPKAIALRQARKAKDSGAVQGYGVGRAESAW
jgi:hypothetical protein